MSQLRDFFQQQGVMEVETPQLSRYANTDPAIESLSCLYQGPMAPEGQTLALHTSPEFAMKRLLAAGSGPIYQICKVFRNGELGRHHNPEFTLLEWYRLGLDHHQLMDEVATVINRVAAAPLKEKRLSYRELFQQWLGIDPHSATLEQLRSIALQQGVADESLHLDDCSAWLDLLMSSCIEETLGFEGMTFVYDFPVHQASLARINKEGASPVAERFELFIGGKEIANGFHELGNAEEQRQRFEQDNQKRLQRGLAVNPIDESLIKALASGLPDCSGVALGIDRLVMALFGLSHIEQSMAFYLTRA
jgi:lysyl-tRNA synthetase class 2